VFAADQVGDVAAHARRDAFGLVVGIGSAHRLGGRPVRQPVCTRR
jgi:hypothetical protein